jgi:hypothetical protein
VRQLTQLWAKKAAGTAIFKDEGRRMKDEVKTR